MIRVLAKAGKKAEILVHEAIGENWYGDGLTSKRFVAELEELGEVEQIHVRINSPGGSVSDGVAIYNALRTHGARIEVSVEGIAASIASIIAMAGDQITMGEGSLMMIHSPWTFAMGSADDMRETADVLDKFEDALIDIYVKRSGQPRDDVRAMLKQETWLNGADAVRLGLADVALSGADEEAAALLQTEYKARFQKFAAKFRQPADTTPRRIAAALKSALADAIAKENPVKDTTSANTVAVTDAVQAALQAENDRRQKIRAIFHPFGDGHREMLDQCLDDSKVTPEAASERLLKAVAAAQPGSVAGDSVTAGKDAREKFLAGAEKAILARSGLEKREQGNEFQGMSLADLAAQALTLSGVSVRGMSRDQVARKILAVHTTSDFPLVLSNTAGKILRKAYDQAPLTWNRWCKKGSVSDFKTHSRHTVGSFSQLATKPEGTEYQAATTAEERETITAVTKGRYIALTREVIVNDDLGAFTDQARKLGRAAAITVERDVYTLLTSDSGNGPVMSDGGKFFNNTAITTAGGHANVSTSAAISVNSLGIAAAAMKRQKDKSLQGFLNIRPRYLVVAPEKEEHAWAVVNSVTDVSGTNPAKKNYVQEVLKLEVLSTPELLGNGWYLFSDPADVEAFEVAFLDGVEEPFIDEDVSFMTDAMLMKVRLDYGAAPIDFRGAHRNAGG